MEKKVKSYDEFVNESKARPARGNRRRLNEGRKRFYQQDGIGRAKYTISYHDGEKKHKDGSDFFDIAIFKNLKALATFKNELLADGYVEDSAW